MAVAHCMRPELAHSTNPWPVQFLLVHTTTILDRSTTTWPVQLTPDPFSSIPAHLPARRSRLGAGTISVQGTLGEAKWLMDSPSLVHVDPYMSCPSTTQTSWMLAL